MLIDYLEPTNIGTFSTVNKYKTDCIEEKVTWLSFTGFSLSMGRGKIITQDNTPEIEYPKPNTSGYSLMKFACDIAK